MVEPAKVKPSTEPRWRTAVPALVILLLVIVAYFPSLRGEFLWDDDYNVIKSAPLRSLDGLRRIWFEPGATQQFYPLTHTSFWLDYHLWGLQPWAYHAENILLHALNAILIWRALRRLGVNGAWLGAALFALHPVCVESVAWITERKNTLSCAFFLLSVLMAVEFWLPRASLPGRKSRETAESSETGFGSWKFYWLTLIFYLCALWSKTATIGLPGVIAVLIWWKRGRLVWRDVVLLLPFLAVGLGMAQFTISIEHRLMVIGSNDDEWHFSLIERGLIAGRALWFYLGKLCWPHPLIFMYPRWALQTAPLPGYVAVAAAAVGVFILWRKRDRWGRPVLAAAGYFVIMLFPVLGFFNVYFFRYSFVCDHFQYLAAIGPLALAAAGITGVTGMAAARTSWLKPATGGVLLLALGVLTWRQTAVYRNLETLWRDVIAQNPESWAAHDNLGIYLSQERRFEEADIHYRRAIALHANDYVAYYDLGLESAIQQNLDQAIQYFVRTLEICPNYALAHYQLGNVLIRESNVDAAISEYDKAVAASPGLALVHYNLGNALVRKGNIDRAIEEYRQASRWDPEFAAAPFSLGNLLVRKGRLDEAVEAYARAVEIQPDYPAAQAAWGRVLAARGETDQAIVHFRKALDLDPNSIEALTNLGNALVHQGQFGQAEIYYRTALRFDSDSPIIHFNLAVALTRQGRTAEGQVELVKAKRLEAERSVVH